jgi:hypothetical protein
MGKRVWVDIEHVCKKKIEILCEEARIEIVMRFTECRAAGKRKET